MHPKDFFTPEQKAQIEAAICEAEKLTSGEIRLHIDRTCKGDVLNEAITVFTKLNMHKTELRNGVLFYLSIEDHKFAVIGDKGINETVPDGFWDCIYRQIVDYFKQGKYTEGLCWAILEAGQQLVAHFPIAHDDTDELTNEISFEK
ncbi:MAG: TPM domain-containing protein [Paludibacteraceae bacterium]|nr:TPM domain-containing protein [Paludibacteraceae bacterium]MBN2786796.1 TPM domain-containing protein [Paludibacteraceae bacterium]